MAVLTEDGKVPSESEKLMIVVIGGSREIMHDFRSFVDIRSRKHVESEKQRIALWITSFKAGTKSDRGR